MAINKFYEKFFLEYLRPNVFLIYRHYYSVSPKDEFSIKGLFAMEKGVSNGGKTFFKKEKLTIPLLSIMDLKSLSLLNTLSSP